MVRTILLVALLIRIAAALVWQGMADANQTWFRFGDSQSYWILAEKVADGKPYDYAGPNSRIFRAPLYPIFLAPATWLDGRRAVLAARIAGGAMGTLAVGLVLWAASAIAGRRAGLCAGALAAIYPGAIGMSVLVLSEAIFCPLCLLCMICWFYALRGRGSIGWAAASGIACGLASLSRPSWFLWPILLATGSLLAICFSASEGKQQPSRIRMTIYRLGIFALAMSLTMSPWWLRNYSLSGRFVATTLQVGASLYDGLHAGASGASDEGMAFSIPFEIALAAEDEAEARRSSEMGGDPSSPVRDLFEWRLNQRLFWAALSWANENRSDTLRLALVKFAKMWNPWPTAKELGGDGIRVMESVVYVVIVGCAGIALWSLPQHRQSMMLYASPTIYFAALHMVFVGSVRYRQPAILALCVVAGIGAAWMLDRINERIKPKLNGKR